MERSGTKWNEVELGNLLVVRMCYAKAKALGYYMGRTAGSCSSWESPEGMGHIVAMDFSPLARDGTYSYYGLQSIGSKKELL